MKSKSSGPHSKAGGMKAHLGCNRENKPTASRSVDGSFSGHKKPTGSSSSRHRTPSKMGGV